MAAKPGFLMKALVMDLTGTALFALGCILVFAPNVLPALSQVVPASLGREMTGYILMATGAVAMGIGSAWVIRGNRH